MSADTGEQAGSEQQPTDSERACEQPAGERASHPSTVASAGLPARWVLAGWLASWLQAPTAGQAATSVLSWPRVATGGA
jgi:hypothetical protein